MSKSTIDDGFINLDFFRKQAKKLLQQMKLGSAPEKILALKQKNPHAEINLASAQWIIANELGFASWQKLKAHVDTLLFSAQHPNFIADQENQTTHWRCGHDIQHKLSIAGFMGKFSPFTDPLCIGPVPALPFDEYHALRTRYISQLFNIPLNSVTQQFDEEYRALSQFNHAQRAVLWCEADPYDQLFLIRVLASIESPLPTIELIDIDKIPGVKRFIGLGQLSPEVLAWLWTQRRPIGQSEILLAKDVWTAFTHDSPELLAKYAAQHFPILPLLAPALRRMLQEYPNSQTGLSLTETLALRYIQANPDTTLEKTFNAMVTQIEPLPFLGDMMFYALLKPMLTSSTPLLMSTETQLALAEQPLYLTPLAADILQGKAYALDFLDDIRWVGGVNFEPHKTHWTLNNAHQLELRIYK